MGLAVLMALLPIVTSLPWFVSGLLSGVVLAGGLAFALWLTLISDGSLAWRVGALGEFWTSEELRKLGRNWVVLNSLNVPGDDGRTYEIDHVAVGPGGVLVVDTKLWPSKDHRLDTTASPYINDAALKAHRQAGVVRLVLRDLVPSDAVAPTVMFWGSDLLSAADRIVTNHNGVSLVHGRDSSVWLDRVATTHRLDDDRATAAVTALHPYLIAKQRLLRDTKPPNGWSRRRPS